MTITTPTRQLEIENPKPGRRNMAQRQSFVDGYEAGAIAALGALENSRGARLEAALMNEEKDDVRS